MKIYLNSILFTNYNLSFLDEPSTEKPHSLSVGKTSLGIETAAISWLTRGFTGAKKVAVAFQEVRRGCLCKRQPLHHGANGMRDELGWSPLQPLGMGGVVPCHTSGSACARVVKRMRHEGAPQARGGWTRGFGQGPTCSTEHQEVFSKHWDWGKEDQQRVNSIFRQHGSYQDRNFTSCGCGTDSNPPPMHWLHFFSTCICISVYT